MKAELQMEKYLMPVTLLHNTLLYSRFKNKLFSGACMEPPVHRKIFRNLKMKVKVMTIILFTWVPQKAEPKIKAYVPELHQDV